MHPAARQAGHDSSTGQVRLPAPAAQAPEAAHWLSRSRSAPNPARQPATLPRPAALLATRSRARPPDWRRVIGHDCSALSPQMQDVFSCSYMGILLLYATLHFLTSRCSIGSVAKRSIAPTIHCHIPSTTSHIEERSLLKERLLLLLWLLDILQDVVEGAAAH